MSNSMELWDGIKERRLSEKSTWIIQVDPLEAIFLLQRLMKKHKETNEFIYDFIYLEKT